MLVKTLLEVILDSFMTKHSKIPLFSQYSQIEKLLKLKSSKKYEYFYLNKEKIHKILYEKEKIIKIQSNTQENSLCNLFFIILLIKHQPYYTNYIYEYNYIKNVDNFRKSEKSNLARAILSMIVIELINNYREADDYYDSRFDTQLNQIYEENEKIKSDFNFLNDYNIKISEKEIEKNNIEGIYLTIISSLIKDGKLEDLVFATNILEQMDLKKINITENIFQNLLVIFNDKKNYVQKYMITNIDDLYDNKKINFYYILFKYLFKNSVYIYNVSFLFQNRKTILKIIKSNSGKFQILNKNINTDMKKKLEYVIKTFCDSNYYCIKYLGSKYDQLKHIFKFYKNYLFSSKINDLKIINNFINNLNIEEIEYDKYLEDFEKAQKMNDRYPVIRYLYEEENQIDDINENEINKYAQIWEKLEKYINDKKIKKMIKKYKEILKKYFNNSNNKDILLTIFSKDIYDYFLKEINNVQKNKKEEKIENEQIIQNQQNIELKEENNNEYDQNDKNELSIEISEIPEKEEISYITTDGKENKVDKTLKVLTVNTICSNNKSNINNIKNTESKISMVYNTEIQKEEYCYFNDNDFYLLEYKDIIGTHENNAEFITEMENGYFVSGGKDKNLLIYNPDYSKIMDIKNKDWTSSIFELKTKAKSEIDKKDFEFISCTKKNIYLVKIDGERFESKIIKNNVFSLNCPSICLEVFKNNHLICGNDGIYYFSDLFSKIIVSKSNKIINGAYKGGIKISRNIFAFSSNKILKGGENKLIFFNSNSRKIIKNIYGYSFITSAQGLAVMPREEIKTRNKFLLCACKKYEAKQKNGILLVNMQIEDNKIHTNYSFYNTGDYEVNCFCQILLKEKKDWERILSNENKFIDTDYFLVGGFNNKKGKGMIKLYKLIRRDIENIKIEFIQDIEIENNKFKGFNGPISCITQSKRSGKILVSCWDGNISLFDYPRIDTFLRYDEKTKYDSMSLMMEEERSEIEITI